MPYDIVKKDGKHCVVKKDDGKTMGCHDTPAGAEAQIAALHANEGKSAPTSEAERRACDAEMRFVAPTEGKAGLGMLSGYAAVFGALSLEMGSSKRFRERIAPGAFRAALESGDNTLAFYHHGAPAGGPAMPLGSTRDGSLRLREDEHGLAFDLDLPDTTVARDLAELVRRGTVRGVSFSWPTRAARDTWQNEGGTLLRTIHEIRTLIDVSPTHLPAYPDTALAVRSLEAWEGEEAAEKDVEARRRRRLSLAEADASLTGGDEAA
jgi:HK97 family phage prohead protease